MLNYPNKLLFCTVNAFSCIVWLIPLDMAWLTFAHLLKLNTAEIKTEFYSHCLENAVDSEAVLTISIRGLCTEISLSNLHDVFFSPFSICGPKACFVLTKHINSVALNGVLYADLPTFSL